MAAFKSGFLKILLKLALQWIISLADYFLPINGQAASFVTFLLSLSSVSCENLCVYHSICVCVYVCAWVAKFLLSWREQIIFKISQSSSSCTESPLKRIITYIISIKKNNNKTNNSNNKSKKNFYKTAI